ncbi:MAG: hypothetical protein JXA75_00655 [Candidatus Thermoplasmatota archaeon]|nr:hypothetical protein [Candidatus Thermoplasmatota archaeon]
MTIDWKILSYAMIISSAIVWTCSVVVSLLFIQPLLDMWSSLPDILSGNTSYTYAESSLPSIPLWILLLSSLFLWIVSTFFLYGVINILKKRRKENALSVKE